jgi:F420-0:gamma-glutamyl ligase
MKATAIRTRKVTAGACTIEDLLDESLPSLGERSVLVVTSKVVSLCENCTLPLEGTNLPRLVRDEAEWYMPDDKPRHGYMTTIAHDMLTLNSGVDESNADGRYVLWPLNPQATANKIRQYLVKRFGLKEVAVVLVDSSFIPLRWGAIGLSLSHSGIEPVRSYADKSDLFGRPLRLSRTNIVDSLATTATLLMGEGNEQTPLAVIEDIPNVTFMQRDPSAQEIAARHTPPHEDMYGALLGTVRWEQGGAPAHAKQHAQTDKLDHKK